VLVLLSALAAFAAHPRGVSPSILAFAQSSSTGSQQQQSAAAKPGTAQIVMKAVSYRPAELTIPAGETVEFKNEDIFAHTVTADDGSFDSGLIQPSSSWTMKMPNQSVSFHCRPHPNMKGKLVLASAPAGNKSEAKGLPGFNPPRGPHEFHPILVNFTAALLPLAFLSDLLGRLLNRKSLHNTAAWMVLYAAIITPLTGLAGWWWKSQVGADLPRNLITVHQWLGTSLAVIFIALAVWRWRIQKRDGVPALGYLVVTGIVVLALVYQGSVGGLMAFGK
jgi:plastocyanin/uncharacterized membrane protein